MPKLCNLVCYLQKHEQILGQRKKLDGFHIQECVQKHVNQMNLQNESNLQHYCMQRIK